MRIFCRDSLICLFLIFTPTICCAMSRIKDADAVITMRNGLPCFSYPQDAEIQKRPYSFGGLSVSKSGPQSDVRWVLDVAPSDSKRPLEPDSPRTCIEYSVPPLGTKVIEQAKPLEFDTPYEVLLVVYSRSEGAYYERKYLSNFCLCRNESGKTVLVGADVNKEVGGWQCLKPGESPKRSFWQKLFGK